jgi:hypothetical protein
MWKKTLIAILVFFLAVSIFANDDRNSAFTYGIEVNMYSMEGIAGGAALGFNFNLKGLYAAGFNLTASSNNDGNSIMEPSIMIRRYFSEGHSAFFAQADLGIAYISEAGRATYHYLLGLRGGYRFHFGSLWHVEPYIRAGYPFIIGAGVMLGFMF